VLQHIPPNWIFGYRPVSDYGEHRSTRWVAASKPVLSEAEGPKALGMMEAGKAIPKLRLPLPLLVSGLCGFLLYAAAGCLINPIHYKVVNTEGLQTNPGILLIDPNDGPCPFNVIQNNDGTLRIQWEVKSQIHQKELSRVEYHRLYSTNRFMVVDGQLGNRKNKYPVVLDTGASQSIFIKDIHVLDNKLPIYPLKTDKSDSEDYNWGLCHLDELHIGAVTLTDWPCFYLERHIESKLFGLLPVDRDDSIILGLPVLQAFKYIVFDSVKKEVEFSHSQVFQPKNSELWTPYPFSIEEDLYGNMFLFVEFTIAGQKVKLQLDSGSGDGLAIRQQLWETIHQTIRDIKLKTGSNLYPYIGRLPCRQGIVGELELRHGTIKDAKLSVFPDDSPILSECQGLLGMQYFQDTVMVLDFERELMWVKNQQS